MAVDFIAVSVVSGLINRLARAQDKKSRVSERKAVPFVKKFSRSVKKSAKAALLKKEKVEFSKESEESIVEELLLLALLTYVNVYSAYADSTAQIDLKKLTKPMAKIIRPRVADSLELVIARLNASMDQITAMQVSKAKSASLLDAELESMGVTPASSGYLRTLVATHAAVASSAALWHRTQADDSVWGYQYVDFGDDRVRPEHKKLNGIVRKKDDPIWLRIWPPNGYNCRCQGVALKTKRRQTRIPKDIKIDEGFDFNSGILLS